MANTVYPRIKTDPAQYKKAAFSKTWESAEDFPTVELSEERVRADMQALHDEMKEYVNGVLIKDVAESFDAVADVVTGKVDSVNGKTGAVTLTAADVGAVPVGESGIISVSSVNGKTGDVTLTAADVGAVPVGEGGIIGVSSVNGRSGNVTLTSEDVGLGNLDNERQYSASNPPPYPVASVNGKTGAVNLTADDIGARPSDWTPSKSNIGLGLVENERQYSAANPPPYPVTAVNGQTGVVAVQPSIVPGSLSLTASWEDHETYFTQALTFAGMPANGKVDLQPDYATINQLIDDGVTSLYVVNTGGVLTAYATGAAPTAALTIQCTITEVG